MIKVFRARFQKRARHAIPPVSRFPGIRVADGRRVSIFLIVPKDASTVSRPWRSSDEESDSSGEPCS
jgi:hypothetical protein